MGVTTVTFHAEILPGVEQGPSWDQVQVLEIAMEPRFLSELMGPSGRTNRTKFRDQVLRPLLEAGLLEMTIPDKPRSSKQQYRITEAGWAVLANVRKARRRKVVIAPANQPWSHGILRRQQGSEELTMLICAAGDIHGAMDQMYEDVLAFEDTLGVRFEWVLHVGDFGIWPDPNRIDKATKKHDGAGDFPTWFAERRAAPRKTVFIKGNHEDFVWLDAQHDPEVLPGLFYLRNGRTMDRPRRSESAPRAPSTTEGAPLRMG